MNAATTAGRPLRICLISQEFPPYTNWGGVAAYSGVLADALAARGHDVTVVSRAAPGAPANSTTLSGARVLRIGMPIRRKMLVGRTIDRVWHARAVARTVRGLERSARFDVLETTEANFEGGALLEAPDFARRMVIQCNGSNAYGQRPSGPLAFAHRLDWAWSLRHELRGLARVARVIAASEATRDVLLGQGVAAEKIRLISQGIDTGRFRPGPGRDPREPLAVAFVGRLERRKGLDFVWRVVEALSGDTGIVFHFKGALHPSARAETTGRLARHRATVVYRAPGSHEEMPAFYHGMDALLLPSRFENFGLVYAEAMACGLVVFAGIGGSAGEVVHDGETGFLVDPDGPVDGVVESLRRLAVDRTAFAAMQRAARADVAERFSLDRCIDRKVALYRELAS